MSILKSIETLRRVQLTGGGTLIVSLPKEWTKRVGLKPGDYVSFISEPDGSLRVQPSTKPTVEKESTSITIDRGVTSTVVIRELMSRYLSGYKSITIMLKSYTPSIMNVLREAVSKKLVGAEIIEEEKDKIVIQILVNIHELPTPTIIKRMVRVVDGMIYDTLYALSNFDEGVLNSVIDRDDIVDKFYLYVVRQLNSVIRGLYRPQDVGLQNLREILEYRALSKSIERIGDHAQKLAKNIMEIGKQGTKLPNEITGNIVKLGEEIRGCFNEAVKSFLEKNKELAHKVLITIETDVDKKVESIINRSILASLDYMSIMSLGLIEDSLRRILDYSMDIAELAIDMTA